MKKYKIALVGASGVVGRETLKILQQRNFPIGELHLLASSTSVGMLLPFGAKNLVVEPLSGFDFSGIDLVFFAAPSDIASRYIWQATAKGAVVIDNSANYRADKDVPLIIPEINADKIFEAKKKNIAANASSAAIPLLLSLKPLHDFANIKRVVVSTYQSVSRSGRFAMDELSHQSVSVLKGKKAQVKHLQKQIAFNVLPQIGNFRDDGSSMEEWKIAHDIGRVLSKKIKVSATCVRVPVQKGHAESVNVEFTNPVSVGDAAKLLRKAPGIKLLDNMHEYATPFEVEGSDEVFISRLRADNSVKNGLNLWIVTDNLRKGVALNAVQIAEELIKNALIG